MQSTLTNVIGVWLILTLTLVTVYDLYCLLFSPQTCTVSLQLYRWGQSTPSLYFWVGLCVGHLILPLVVKNGGP